MNPGQPKARISPGCTAQQRRLLEHCLLLSWKLPLRERLAAGVSELVGYFWKKFWSFTRRASHSARFFLVLAIALFGLFFGLFFFLVFSEGIIHLVSNVFVSVNQS